MKSYIDIVDISPIETESLFIVNESVGSTELSKEQFNSLFKGRNLVFISTLSADGFHHITPGPGLVSSVRILFFVEFISDVKTNQKIIFYFFYE